MTTETTSLPHATKRRQILTSDRIRGYGSMIIAVNGLMLALTFWTPIDKPTVFGARFAGDFACFYIAGGMVNGGVPLYDLDAQDRRFFELQPNAHRDHSLPYTYAPFFALLFSPLALLPLKLAFALWLAISVVLYVSGFHFAWESCDLPGNWKRTALIASLAFIPFSVFMLGEGQVVAFGFFFLALAIYLEKKGQLILAGIALSFLIYKPILPILIVPMLLATKRFRVATGFVLGALALGLLSLWLVGISGIGDFLHALDTVRRASETSPHFRSVSLVGLVKILTGRNLPIVQYGAMLAVFVLLMVVWLKMGRSKMSWALAITFTLFVNLYTPIYDTTYLVISAILTADYLHKSGPLDSTFKALLCVLFILPLPILFIPGGTGLSVITIAILALGVYQSRLNGDREIVIPVNSTAEARIQTMLIR